MNADVMPVWAEADLIVRRAQRRITWRSRAAVAVLCTGLVASFLALAATVVFVFWSLLH